MRLSGLGRREVLAQYSYLYLRPEIWIGFSSDGEANKSKDQAGEVKLFLLQ